MKSYLYYFKEMSDYIIWGDEEIMSHVFYHLKLHIVVIIQIYIGYFANFGQCNNSIIVSGSLDYLHIVLSREELNLQMKYDLLNLILQYVMDVKEIYELCDGNSRVFEYLNLMNWKKTLIEFKIM